MHKVVITILILLFVSVAMQAQPVLTQKEADTRTLSLYNSAKWSELISEGEEVIEKNIDFYYLRMRIGIAYYTKKDYMKAIEHFEKALKFNPVDLIAMEYLYYSYLFSGRESEALTLIYDMPFKLKKKLDVYPKFMYGLYSEGGATANKDYGVQKNVINTNLPKIYNEQEVFNNGFYYSINLKHQLGKYVNMFHGYNTISVNTFDQIYDQNIGLRTFDLHSTQQEYYNNINFNLGDGYNLTPAFHYLRVKLDDVDLNYDHSVNPWIPLFTEVITTENDFVFSLSLSKFTGHFNFAFKNSVSNLNKATQTQNTLEMIFYPLGNLNLYTVTDATLFSNKDWGEKRKSFGIVNQKIGLKTFNYLWMEAGFTFGNIFNFNEADAFIVYNNTNKYTNRLELNFIAPLTRNLELSLRYQRYQQEVPTTYYVTTKSGNTILSNNIHNKLIGGIKWTF